MSMSRRVDEAFADSKWRGITTRVAFAIAAMVLVHWLRDIVSWVSSNIFHDNYVITDAQHVQAVVGVTILGAISIFLELIYATILFFKDRHDRKGERSS